MSNKKTVLVLVRLPAPGRAVLEARDDIEVRDVTDWSEENLIREVKDAHGAILGVQPFTKKVIDAAPEFRIAARFGVGYDEVDVPALTARGIPLAVVGTANSVSVAEQALFMMLSLAKRGTLYDKSVRAGEWTVRFGPLANDLWQKTVLILGFGRIGTRLAKRCAAFEMTVKVFDPYVDAATITSAGYEAVSDLDAALADADFVSVNCPRNADTIGLIGEKALKAMKPTAYLVNTARGGIVDEAALLKALQAGEIAGAGLDVLSVEPATPDNPLLKLDSVIFSPHSAGVSKEAAERMGVAAAQNVLDALDGKPNSDNIINREVL